MSGSPDFELTGPFAFGLTRVCKCVYMYTCIHVGFTRLRANGPFCVSLRRWTQLAARALKVLCAPK